MGQNTKIEWASMSFNCWWGCTKVSKGCQHCYADTLATRYGNDIWGPTAGRKPMSESYWKQLDKWQRLAEKATTIEERFPRVFCCSMSDLFEGPETCQIQAAYNVVVEGRRRLFEAIDRTPNLQYLLLTKRPENMIEFTPLSWLEQWPANVMAGTSVEDQEAADKRIPELLKVPARHFLSIEPLLGPVSLLQYWQDTLTQKNPQGAFGQSDTWDTWLDGGIDWVIVGGESGPGARPMHPDWVWTLRDQCQAADVPFHFKQWGEWLPAEATGSLEAFEEIRRIERNHYNGLLAKPSASDHVCIIPMGEKGQQFCWRVGKKAAGRLLDGREWNEFPETRLG